MNSDLKPQKYSGRILGLICLRFNQLLALSEATDEGRAFNKALRDIEKRNLQSGCVLPKTYNLFTSTFSL
ncbi:MAG: hypothetical protein NTY53_22140 [Kiritimatiellaeota bacterium]|nr:hypothetical protein [Kiritimatiellota bacterium]